jgi:hypothetical protein
MDTELLRSWYFINKQQCQKLCNLTKWKVITESVMNTISWPIRSLLPHFVYLKVRLRLPYCTESCFQISEYRCTHNHTYQLFKYSKSWCTYHFLLFSTLCMYSLHPHHLTDSCLGVVLLKAPQNTKIKATLSQLLLCAPPASSSSKWHFVWWNETAQNYYPLQTQHKEAGCTYYYTHDANVWLWPYNGKI